MPHERRRHLSSAIQMHLKASPIVGVIGHRQTGKTTLCSHFAKKFSTLDREEDLLLCERGPADFILNQPAPFMIDECQLSPRIFPALKEYVRTHKKTGQFLLTGSVRFSSRKAIQESLTGRILLSELLPMTWSEIHNLPIHSLLLHLHRDGISSLLRQYKARALPDETIISHYLEQGGLPGICFSRNKALRISKFKTHVDTLLDRDLRLILNTSLPKMTLLALLGTLACLQGRVINWESLRRETGISTITLKRLFSAFEALFLLRPVSRWGQSAPDSYYFEDTGLAHFLMGFNNDSLNLSGLNHFLFCNLREAYHYSSETVYSIHTYRSHGGAYIPLVFHAYGSPLGIVPVMEKQPTLSSLRSAESFLRQSPKAQVVIVHFGTEARVLHSRLAAIPWNGLL